MTTRLSSKGQIVLPAAARKRLGLKPGAKFACRVRAGEIVLTPSEVKREKPRFIKDRLTGMTVVASSGSPLLTNERVKALLADFP